MVAEPINSGLHLFTSNRMEILAAKLAQRLDSPLPSPLAREIIVVRNKGMERWLKLELAARHGICANYDFPFPEAFGYRIFRELIPGLQERPPLDRSVLTWRILAVLPKLLPSPEFAALRHYLGDQTDSRKALQVAGRIAYLFDQYLVFRPQLMLEWDIQVHSTLDEAWQAILWRAVSADFPQAHAAALWKQLHEIVSRPSLPATKLPPRISIFGVSAVPPYYLDLFAGLARHLQVNLFLLQPSQEYWGEITSPRESERILRRRGTGDEGAEPAAFQLHLETGNRLLASLGYLGRDFLRLLLEAGDWIPDESFEDPGETKLLHAIQSDILHLRDRGETTPAGLRREEEPDGSGADDSIQVHCCHSPLRELEVLYDHMLDWFQREPGLAPRDMVVMTPDIETYAPLVQAVFGAPEESSRFIPFSVADRAGRRQSRVVDTFLRLLDLPETRLGAATVLEILEAPEVRARFGLEEADVQLVRLWVERTNIRWGIDAQHRARLHLPALGGNTWRDGLDRLLLGYGMSGGGTRLFQGILPYDDLEGSEGPLLGRFLEFMDRVIELVTDLPKPRVLNEWATRLQQMTDQFFETSEETLNDLQVLRDALEDLLRQQTQSRFDRPVERAELLDWLSRALEEDVQQAGFLTGGVTFCGLKPMRSIPFQIICLVGMNDAAFPRPTPQLGFDLMARRPRLGDRSTREDDRYLFLETLLSARRRLYLSYVGQSIRDNSVAPPSVLISELLDYIEHGFGLPGKAGRVDQIVTRHRLQAFSEDYFRPGGRLFSYSQENCRASRSARTERTGPASFCGQPLGEAEPSFHEVTLDRLGSFLANPCRFFLVHRLRVVLPGEPTELEDREPFVLNKLEAHGLKQELVGESLKPAPSALDQARERMAAAGRLPLGEVGQAEYRRLAAEVQRFLDPVEAARADPSRAPLEIDLTLGPFHVTGRIPEFTNAGPLYYRCATLKKKDLLRAWIGHLAVNAVEPGRYTTVLAEDESRHYAPPEHPRELLADLLEVYWRGLQAPLKFFPETAFAFAQAKRKPARGATPADADALRAARREWERIDFKPGRPGEREDLHIAFCFHDTDPLDVEFMALAERIVGPLLYQEIKEAP